MKAFKRIFKYIWPQWPRIIVVVLTAMIVAALLSLSFMTIIPLLKVMMGEEGLHGWVDRKACQWRYGLEFYVPEIGDLTGTGRNNLYSLLITKVEHESLAEKAGFKQADRIVAVSSVLHDDSSPSITYAELLQVLGAAENSLDVYTKRLNQQGFLEDKLIVLDVSPKAALDREQKPAFFYRCAEALKMAALERARWAVSFLSREHSAENKRKAIIYIILFMALVTIIRCIAKFYQGYTAQKIVQVGINQLRQDAFAHSMDMPLAFFDNERPSDTVSRLVRDTNVMSKAIKIMLGKALREPLNALFMLSAAMWLNWQLTLIFFAGAPFVLGLLGVFGRKMKRATNKSLMAASRMLAKLQETMAALKIVKVYNRQQHELTAFKTINRRLLKQLLKISKVDAATSPVMEVLGMMAGSAALVVGAHWVTQNRMDGSGFLVLVILLGAAAEAVRKTSDIWNKIQEANAAAERVFAVMDRPVEFEKPGAVELLPLKIKVEFRDITFTYPGSEYPALSRVNLTVTSGHTVAIVGPNGSGKTTLVNLLPRFYNPGDGQVLIDDRDIATATLKSLRSQIGMVTQNVITFNDTIASNIAYGKPDASREEIVAAAKRSFAHEFISPLPDGYDTIIGEQGTGLSGGQLQRIVIARAIIKNPAILIFDEATSQVDADSEAKIHRAIEEVMRQRTSFVIAHRFSTVINADIIVVMDKGRIIDQGRHDELMQRCLLYRSLYETQLVKA